VEVEYRSGDMALTPDAFIALAMWVWPRDNDHARVEGAVQKTINIGAWIDGRLVGSVRILSDGYLLNTVSEMIVDPDYRRRGIGTELMRRALEVAPGGRLFLRAQPGNEPFFERLGFRRGPIGYIGVQGRSTD
jgi:GNAT superfamily N-acetyltransferase